jgi:hypothetical protein
MAKATKKKQTKSGAVREYLAKKPNAGPTEVSKALKARGITVSPAHVSNVSNVKQTNKPKPRANGKPRTTPAKSAPASDLVSLVQLVEARRFAEQVGGVDAAVSLLQSLGKLLA